MRAYIQVFCNCTHIIFCQSFPPKKSSMLLWILLIILNCCWMHRSIFFIIFSQYTQVRSCIQILYLYVPYFVLRFPNNISRPTILHVKATVNIIEESSSSTHFTSLLSQLFSVEYGTTLIVGYAFEPCDDDHDDNDHGENATTLMRLHYSNEKGAKLTQQYQYTTCYIMCIPFFPTAAP